MTEWMHFLFVVSGQFLILLIIARLRGIDFIRFSSVLWRGVLLGLPLGFLYDILIGHSQAVFYYSRVPDNWIFTALNGSLSYGFAIATACLLPITLKRHHLPGLRLIGALVCGIAIILLSLTSLIFSPPTLAVMFITGTSLLLCSEGLSLIYGYSGPLYSLLQRNVKPTASLWLASICIGALYELLNGLFPLWHWQEARNMPHWQLEFLIVIFGYFTLFLPMLILGHIFIRNKE